MTAGKSHIVLTVLIVLGVALAGCGTVTRAASTGPTATPTASVAPTTGGLAVTVMDGPMLVADHPLGDSGFAHLATGESASALCFVARAHTNTGALGTAIGIDLERRRGFIAVAITDPETGELANFLDRTAKDLAGHLPRCKGVPDVDEQLDSLVLSLRFDSTKVSSGGDLSSRLIVSNPTDETIVETACQIAAGRYALVPITDPRAELWVQPVLECGGTHEMVPGYREESDGPTFPAHTKYGDPLTPGEYLAVLDIVGRSQPLEYAITVE